MIAKCVTVCQEISAVRIGLSADLVASAVVVLGRNIATPTEHSDLSDIVLPSRQNYLAFCTVRFIKNLLLPVNM